jgi:hypothetical protein
MHIEDPATKRSHVAKRLRIRIQHDQDTVRCDRIREWIIFDICLAIASGFIVAVLPNPQSIDLRAMLVLGSLIGAPLMIALLCHLVWGWRLTLNLSESVCVYRRTYAGFTCRKVKVPISDCHIGPYPVRIK